MPIINQQMYKVSHIKRKYNITADDINKYIMLFIKLLKTWFYHGIK